MDYVVPPIQHKVDDYLRSRLYIPATPTIIALTSPFVHTDQSSKSGSTELVSAIGPCPPSDDHHDDDDNDKDDTWWSRKW